MLFPEDDAPLLKTWIVKRIENTSDADADVLAEYVIALLKHDGDIKSVRELCEQEIPDFLTEDPKIFLDDVFRAIEYKSYVPGAPPPPPKNATPTFPPRSSALDPTALPYDSSTASSTQNGSRKRGLGDRDDHDSFGGREGPQQQGGRAFKQARRGGRGGRGGSESYPPMLGFPQRSDMPPFDPNSAMEMLMQMQAMGLPFPGMPAPQGFRGGRNQTRRRGRCRDFDTKGYCSRGNTCMYDHGNESVFVPPMPMGQNGEEYDPNDAMLSMTNPQNPMNLFGFNADAGRGRGGRRSRGGKKSGTRAAFSADGPVHDRSKSTIVVENIPEEHFNQDEVRTFFSQFGNVVDISMQPYKHLAVVKYDNWTAANAAYRSPKVIFDNRFVKVFWHKDEQEGPRSSSANGSKKSNANAESGDLPDADPEAEPEPEMDIEEFHKRQEEAQKQHEERETKRAELEQKRQELEKQQQELLAKHREENERLQAKLLGQNDGNGEGGSGSSGTDMLRAKLAALEQEAKILGIDPNATEETELGGYPSRGGGYRGRGGYRARGFAPRGRGSLRGRGGMHAAYAQYSIDNRPKKLAITGVDFTASSKDEQLRHFLLGLGEFESVDPSPAVTHVSFQDRKTAEKFYFSLHGKELPGVEGKLDLQWVNTPLPPVSAAFNGGNGSNNAKEDADVDGSEDQGDAMMDNDDDDGSREKERNEMPPQREERQVDMDYEVADEDIW